MLLALLKNVKRWVFKFVFENKIADVDTRIYFGDKNDSNKG